MKKTSLNLAVALILSATSQLSFASDADLQKQLSSLKQQIETLQQRLNVVEAQPQVKATVVAPVNDSVDSYSTEDADGSELAAGPTPATSDDIEGVRSDLENYKYDQSRQYERQTVKSARDTTLFGTVQLRANVQDNNTAPNTPKSTFDVGTALLGVRGNLFKDYNEGKNLDYQASFGYSKRNDGSNNSNFNLLDAYLRYHVLSTNGGAEVSKLNLTLGQQLLPFGLDVQSPEDLRPTISTATAPTYLGLFTRQNGLIVRGDAKPFVDYGANYRAPLFEYAIGVTNGNGSNKTDDNNGKDYIGRVAFTLPVDYASWLREFKVGASYIKGEAKLSGSGITDNKAKRDRLGFDVYYNHAPFGVTYEYLQGKTGYIDATAAAVKEAKAEGHTFTAFYTLGDQFYNSIKSNAKFDDFWPKSIQGYYRYDSYNPNKNQKDYLDTASGRIGEYDIHSLGLNLFFAQTTKFQLQLNHYIYDIEAATQKDTNELQAQFQYTF
ncbi:carbohydrate porin [Acinetobacter terrae]|uniref:Carbohydrate porin n=1 Tax=Acinetobacter terrae TaxID=2731247 RepID=A0A4R0EMU8_9GAMM|nr:carbohydrate porin [Acinetobacter terrae]TCB59633.1 carbohydrate porin [Acinetobacter terrae]